MKSGLLRDKDYQMEVATQVTREMLANQVRVLQLLIFVSGCIFVIGSSTHQDWRAVVYTNS